MIQKTSLVMLVALGLAACSSAVPDTQNTDGTQPGVTAGAAPEPAQATPPPPPSPEAMFKRLDRDGNGTVESSEVPPFLQQADSNHDGRLTLEELKAHHETMRAHGFGPGGGKGRHHGPPPSPEALLKKLDRDQNGTLAGDEVPPFLSDADSDKNGTLTLAELRAHGEKRRAEHFARMDTNTDGSLTADEIGERRFARLSVADANHDAKVSRDELDQAHAQGKLGPPMGPPRGFMHHGPDGEQTK